MANKMVRSIREVKDVNKLAQHVTTENDLVSTTDGSVYIVTKNGYKLITDGANLEDIEPLKTDIESLQSEQTSLKSENTKLKNRVTALETSNTDLITRIEALENPEPADVSVTGVTLDKSTLSLEVGATATLNATIAPSNASYKAVSFTSSDDTVATVDDKGLVTAVAPGSADITVESLADGSKTAKCTLTVTETPAE